MGKIKTKQQAEREEKRQAEKAAALREAEMSIMELRRKISEGSQWRHVRSGVVYTVVCLAINENSMKPAVVYHRMAGIGPTWTRPAKEFMDGRFKELPT